MTFTPAALSVWRSLSFQLGWLRSVANKLIPASPAEGRLVPSVGSFLAIRPAMSPQGGTVLVVPIDRPGTNTHGANLAANLLRTLIASRVATVPVFGISRSATRFLASA